MTVNAKEAPTVAISLRAESARYALLRRLAPSMRHHLVVNLQPIGMIYEVMDRRLRSPEPNLNELRESAQKINGFARAAIESSLDVVTWLAPDEQKFVPAADGVRECFGLLATSLTFRGYSLRNEVTSLPAQVHRGALRVVLTGALVCMTDTNAGPADLVLSGKTEGDSLVLTLVLRPGEGEAGFSGEVPYRRLQWEDVEALAASESVAIEREGRQQVRMTFPSGEAS